MIEEVTIPYSPRGVFKPFHYRKDRWAVVVAHRRCGKTVACINDLIRRAFTDAKTDGRYAYIAPFHSQAKTIAWDYLLRYSEPVRVSANQSELWIELDNGARIRLFGADNPDALRGLYLDGVILDEYADMRPRVWGEIIRPLLADRKGWAVFIGTPKGHNAFHQVYKDAGTLPNWFQASLSVSVTKLLDDEELTDARRTMTEDQYLQEFECSFEAAILGAYYGKEMRELTEAGRVTKVDYDPSVETFTAWDLGYSDDTSIWWFQVVSGEIHLIDYHSSHGHNIKYYTDLVLDKPYKVTTHYLPHDARAKTLASGGRSVIEQLADGLTLGKLKIVPSLSVQDGIQAVRMALPRCWFDHKTEEGIECLRQYQREYDDDKKIFRDKPRHDFTSHGADAFRMMAIAWKEKAAVISSKVVHPVQSINGRMVTAPLNDMWKTGNTKDKRI